MVNLNEYWLSVSGCRIRSRLIVGIEQYTSVSTIRTVLEASRCDVLIVGLSSRHHGVSIEQLSEQIPISEYNVIGTTSFCATTDEAVRAAIIMRDQLGITLIKLDVRSDALLSVPDNQQTIRAATILLREGFSVAPMITPDALAARRLEELGCCALRLMVGRIRSCEGITDSKIVRRITDELSIPCVGEGGVGSISDVIDLFDEGVDAVLVNTLIAKSQDPQRMAEALYHAARSGALSVGLQ